jgi:hypothetical protein
VDVEPKPPFRCTQADATKKENVSLAAQLKAANEKVDAAAKELEDAKQVAKQLEKVREELAGDA